MQRLILHLDMNSYFASVEQQANPFFRGKPVGVCAYLSGNGCIIASSIEAKKVGIKTGFRVKDAKKLYPNVILIENDPNKYRAVTRKFFEIMTSYSGDFEPYSIDEAFLDLTGWVRDFNKAFKVASQIRQQIKSEIGKWLKCSIGISFTKFLAKFASDVAEVDQTTVIKSVDELDDIFSRYKLTDLWGINFRLEERLNALGIQTILDLKNWPVQNLIQAFGKPGYYLWTKVNGIEIEHFKNQEELLSKSIGHSYCLPKQTVDKKYLSSILSKLVFKVGQRLCLRSQVAYGLYIYWSYVSGGGFNKQLKLKKSVYTTDNIFKKALSILNQTKLTDKVRMLAVGVFNLSEPSNQLSLFNHQETHNLTRALDNINRRYGKELIYRGRMWKTQEYAKDRIGFRKVEL